ncbi:nucleoside-diphosphate sugar epimerase [Catenuloplanes atrovinosus]|uniref:Uncharacterized protein YbjT (DUF2867 family) n=1 Tax=Catenuloplanes atrovinosus TaxID=137266 RepID=A0AAE3YJR8_9ACTN|nr:nucleoside-diphosphate sugar epimerase [Catenuloplanes atrovinosus]MDR7275044.1 uncharacterized protein YbjT (DUF2867 family) [Catenuloplanes atrovinosus]
MSGTALVIGATGNVGRHVVVGLRERAVPVRGMSRRRGGDLASPVDLERAAEGVDAVFLIWPFMTADLAKPVAGRLAGRHIVYLSAMSAETGFWGEVESAIRGVTDRWTFLRPSGFATNTLGWAERIRTTGTVRMPYPAARRSLIHERDIADVALLALTAPAAHAGRTHVITGPSAVSQAEQVRLIGDAIGRELRVQEQPRAEARAELLRWASPEFADASLDYWASLVGTPEPVTRTVEEQTGRPARGFAAWARDHAADFS